MRHLRYFIQEALANIRVNQTTTVVAIATTAFTMGCFGVFLLLYLNVRGLMTSVQDEIKVIVYLADGLSLQESYDLEQQLKAQPEVAEISYVSKEQALTEFRHDFPSEAVLLQGLGDNPLPASLVVTIAGPFRSTEFVNQWVDRTRALPGVEQLQYNRDWIDAVTAIVRYVEWTAIAVGIVLSAAAVAIIASTIRLTLYARRDDIEIMRLIGATAAFIRMPYLLEGALVGALGALLSIALLKAAFEFFKLRLGAPAGLFGGAVSVAFFPPKVSLSLIAAGLVLGSLASLVSLSAFERMRV